MKAIFLDVKNDMPPKMVDIEDNLDNFYALLDCDTVDIVQRRSNGTEFCVICDDCGKLKKRWILSAYSGMDIFNTYLQMAGNLILTGLPTEDGVLTSIKSKDAEKICFEHVQTLRKPKGYYRLILD